MKLIAASVAAAISVLSISSPALADEARIATQTTIKVMPGAAATTFHDGDPIRICVSSQTETASSDTLHMSIEYRAVKDGAAWKVIAFDLAANKTGCMFAAVHGHRDMQVRARTLNGPTNSASASRKITLNVV